ncbi:MAG: DUF4157 domain-containing protein [Pseudomonadota bacterium]
MSDTVRVQDDARRWSQPEVNSGLRQLRKPVTGRAPASPRLLQLQALANGGPQVSGLRALQAKSDGVGAELSAGIEALSGVSMEGVQVHRNSPQPAAIGALAFAQGRDIHLGPGQEQHLPHEAWHVAQQATGRVKPTAMVNGVAVNDNAALETEADVMGARALQHGASLQRKSAQTSLLETATFPEPVQTPYAAVAFQRQAQIADIDAQLGTTTTVMSSSDYANWKETAQAKAVLHGSAPIHGDRVVVSQMQRSGEVAQRFLSKKAKAGLLIFEGVVTIAAGTSAAILTGGIGTLPGILAAVVGFIKCCRGLAMWKFANDAENATEAERLEQEYQDRAAFRTKILDGMRALEAVTAIVGGAIAGNPAIVIFGIAKTVRSTCTAISNYMGENTAHPILKKMIDAGGALAHAIEVGSLAFAGGAALSDASSAATKAGAYIKISVAASKGLRTADQVGGLIPEKGDAENADEEDAGGWAPTGVKAPRTEPDYVT